MSITAVLIGLALIAVVWALFTGGGGRWVIVAAVVVGVSIGLAGQLVGSGMDLAQSLTELVARLGNL
jgi:hypothetical protein